MVWSVAGDGVDVALSRVTLAAGMELQRSFKSSCIVEVARARHQGWQHREWQQVDSDFITAAGTCTGREESERQIRVQRRRRDLLGALSRASPQVGAKCFDQRQRSLPLCKCSTSSIPPSSPPHFLPLLCVPLHSPRHPSPPSRRCTSHTQCTFMLFSFLPAISRLVHSPLPCSSPPEKHHLHNSPESPAKRLPPSAARSG